VELINILESSSLQFFFKKNNKVEFDICNIELHCD